MNMILPELPVIGTAGHTVGALKINATKEIAGLKTKFVKGCPINRRTPTRITRTTFKRLCITYQKQAGVFTEETPTGSSSTRYGWVTNNISICTGCKIGINVREGKRYATPYNMAFISKGEWNEITEKRVARF